MERILGVDEAGRGSVLGPLVVGGYLVRSDRLDELRAAGACDSKEISAHEREQVYAKLPRIGECRSVVLTPREIDRFVAHGRLNELEARAFGALVRQLMPDVARVDACDTDPRRFARAVRHWAGARVPVVASHHADRDDVVVGAASIVAKVRRDRAIERLRVRLGVEIGSGYPSDDLTVAFLREHLAHGAVRPPWVRIEWATMQRVKPERPGPTLDGFDP
jgi:ribonuclease HII